MKNKAKTIFKQLKRLSIQKMRNPCTIAQYLRKYVRRALPITFFNWESFDVFLNPNSEWQTNFSIKQTNCFQKKQEETAFVQDIQEILPKARYIKIIPDEQILLLWPELLLKKSSKQITTQIRKFKQELDNYISKNISRCIKVYNVSQILNRKKEYKIKYISSFNMIKRSFDMNYNSPFINAYDFEEDLSFRRNHYSEKEMLDKRSLRQYSILMFSLFAGETTLLLELEKDRVFPNLILANNEPMLTIKKYETLSKYYKREELPKIFPFTV